MFRKFGLWMNRKDYRTKDPVYLVDKTNPAHHTTRYYYYDADPYPTVEEAVAWMRRNLAPKRYDDFIMLKKVNFKNSKEWRSYPEPDVKTK